MAEVRGVGRVSALTLKNFRGFGREQRIELAPLTFLVGPNSSGKSSLVDAILLFAQSPFVPLSEDSFVPVWIGPLVDLGSYKDTVHKHNSNLDINIGFEFRDLPLGYSNPKAEAPRASPVSLSYRLHKGAKDDIGYVASVSIGDLISGELVTLSRLLNRKGFAVRIGDCAIDFSLDPVRGRYQFATKFLETVRAILKECSPRRPQAAWRRILAFIESPTLIFFIDQTERVSSGRAGPLRWYPTQAPKRADSASYYTSREPLLLDRIEPTMIHNRSVGRSLGKQEKSEAEKTEEIGDALQLLNIASQISREDLSAYHSSISIIDNVTRVRSNLADVGYGASQVMPVLVGCTSEYAGPLFVEQPEIHLHPKAQGTVAQLLCDASRRRQVIIETHSEHMINRARILVAKGELSPSDVAINYVNRTKSGSQVQRIELLADGEFATPWPGGFFDERYYDTMTLMELRSKKGVEGAGGN